MFSLGLVILQQFLRLFRDFEVVITNIFSLEMPKKIPEFLEEFPGKNRGLVYVDGDDNIFYGKHKYVFLFYYCRFR